MFLFRGILSMLSWDVVSTGPNTPLINSKSEVSTFGLPCSWENAVTHSNIGDISL